MSKTDLKDLESKSETATLKNLCKFNKIALIPAIPDREPRFRLNFNSTMVSTNLRCDLPVFV